MSDQGANVTLGDLVVPVDNPMLEMMVTAIEYRPSGVSYELAYWLNGERRTVYLSSYLVKPKP